MMPAAQIVAGITRNPKIAIEEAAYAGLVKDHAKESVAAQDARRAESKAKGAQKAIQRTLAERKSIDARATLDDLNAKEREVVALTLPWLIEVEKALGVARVEAMAKLDAIVDIGRAPDEHAGEINPLNLDTKAHSAAKQLLRYLDSVEDAARQAAGRIARSFSVASRRWFEPQLDWRLIAFRLDRYRHAWGDL